jgi:Rrf2 family protein
LRRLYLRLSRRAKYALLALVDLCGQESSEWIPLADLAGRSHIPLKSLEEVFRSLRNAGIVNSQVGLHGGYRLARRPNEVTVGEVIRRIDGTVAPVSCVSRMAYEPCTCPDESVCPVRSVMARVRDAIAEVIDRTTLSDAAACGRAGGLARVIMPG